MNEKDKLWHKRLAAWRRSGLTQREFCARHDLKLATLGFWQHRLRKVDALPVERDAPQRPRMIPVEVLSTTDVRYEIALAGHRRLSIPARFDVDAVRSLIVLLETTSC